jgi:hypothetical protein
VAWERPDERQAVVRCAEEPRPAVRDPRWLADQLLGERLERTLDRVGDPLVVRELGLEARVAQRRASPASSCMRSRERSLRRQSCAARSGPSSRRASSYGNAPRRAKPKPPFRPLAPQATRRASCTRTETTLGEGESTRAAGDAYADDGDVHVPVAARCRERLEGVRKPVEAVRARIGNRASLRGC